MDLSIFFRKSRLRRRNDLHLLRKVWHLCMGLVIVAIYHYTGMPRALGILILCLVLVCDLMIETARLRSPELNQRVVKIMGPIMRQSEINGLTGIPFYLASSILVITMFPKPVACLAILYLAVGDPIASAVGVSYGKLGPQFANGKSWIGTLAGMLACSLVSWYFLVEIGVNGLALAWLSLAGGVVGGLSEHLPLDLDDNFVIPVFSGFTLWLLFLVFKVQY